MFGSFAGLSALISGAKSVPVFLNVLKRELGQYYLYLPDGTFVNARIIQEGYAYPLTVRPNVKYSGVFKELYNQARQDKKGLWQEDLKQVKGGK